MTFEHSYFSKCCIITFKSITSVCKVLHIFILDRDVCVYLSFISSKHGFICISSFSISHPHQYARFHLSFMFFINKIFKFSLSFKLLVFLT